MTKLLESYNPNHALEAKLVKGKYLIALDRIILRNKNV